MVLRKIKSILFGTFLFFLFATIALYMVNYFLLQTKMDRILHEDSRNEGLIVKLHFEHWFNYKRLVINYQAVTPPADRPAVFRSFFQIARGLIDNRFDQVVIEYRGTPRLMIDGDTFIDLGERYGAVKPMALLLHLAANLRHPNGDRILSRSHSLYASLLESKLKEDVIFDQSIPAKQIFSSLTENR